MFKFLYSKLRIKNNLNKILKLYEISDEFTFEDEITGEKYSIVDLILELNERVKKIEEKYNGILLDVKRLEEENIETSNTLYELINSMEAVDRRIDIVAENPWKEQFE